MNLQILAVLVSAMSTMTFAWPITPLEGYSRTDTHTISLRCGDDLEYPETTFTNLIVNFNNSNGGTNIPAGCKIKFRVALQDLGLEKFGIGVTGQVDVHDNNNGDSCLSSFVSLADEDTPDDELGTIEKLCGEEIVSFNSTEDILVIEFVVGANGATGNGFQLTVTPHYLCGGLIDLEKTIESPDFPNPYPRDINCVWRIQAPSDYQVQVYCKRFDLRPLRRGRCVDFLVFMSGGETNKNCGSSLQNKSVRFAGSSAIVDFRSTKSKNKKYHGFSCRIRFTTAKKSLLMSRFFK